MTIGDKSLMTISDNSAEIRMAAFSLEDEPDDELDDDDADDDEDRDDDDEDEDDDEDDEEGETWQVSGRTRFPLKAGTA